MKMRVVDQLHLSSLGPETMGKGAEFEVSDAMGEDLLKKGVATRVDGEAAEAAAESGEKAEAAPDNKAEKPPANKAEKSARRKRGE